jgi:ABC-type xylose transport system permease subunit
MQSLKMIDHSSIKTSQMILIVLNILAFLFNAPALVMATAAIMLLGTILGAPAFGFFYQWILKPLGWVKPETLPDHPEPHRFAQGLGSIFLLIGILAFFFGQNLLGWSLVWIVTTLAAVNLFAGLCVGCMIYYWLARLKVPGFYKTPPQGVFPGARPKAEG